MARRTFGVVCGAVVVLCTARLLAQVAASPEMANETPAPVYRMLLVARDPVVHQELRLDGKQTKAVQAAVAAVDYPLWLLRDVPVDKCGDKLAALQKVFHSGLTKAMSRQQLARLEQITLRARGAKALMAPDVAEKLQLNDTQRQRFRQIVADAQQGTLDGRRVVAVLGVEQQKTIGELFGQSFDLSKLSQISCQAPELKSVETWLNSSPLTLTALRGKVVVVHFWAFGCINCVHNLPHYQAWHERFSASDLAIVGLHTPETAAERDVDKLRENVKARGIKYPIAFDAAAENWTAWANNIWPSVYLIDRQGQVRGWWYGELNWQGVKGEEAMRKKIEQLVLETKRIAG